MPTSDMLTADGEDAGEAVWRQIDPLRNRAARELDASRADALIGRARDFLRPGVDEKLEQVPRHIFRRLAIPLPADDQHWSTIPDGL